LFADQESRHESESSVLRTAATIFLDVKTVDKESKTTGTEESQSRLRHRSSRSLEKLHKYIEVRQGAKVMKW